MTLIHIGIIVLALAMIVAAINVAIALQDDRTDAFFNRALIINGGAAVACVIGVVLIAFGILGTIQ